MRSSELNRMSAARRRKIKLIYAGPQNVRDTIERKTKRKRLAEFSSKGIEMRSFRSCILWEQTFR